jgi:hypothetical protein
MHASPRVGSLLAAFLAGGAVLVAGCGPPAGPTAKMPPAFPSTPTPPPSPATPATAAGPGPCQAGVVSVLLGNARTAGGTTYYPIDFMNISATSCTLYGFPGVSFADRNYSSRIGPAATRNTSSPEHLIRLTPGASGTALISVANARNYSSGCGQAAVNGLLVEPPGLSNLIRLPFAGLTCVNSRYHVLTVDAVAPGPPAAPGA